MTGWTMHPSERGKATRVLVCGGRNLQDKALVWHVLDQVANVSEDEPLGCGITVIHGGCSTGADMWADGWAIANWTPMEVYAADWTTHGRAAGPIRNARMIAKGKPDLVIAFAGGAGTRDMVRKARAAGIPVREITPTPTHTDHERR